MTLATASNRTLRLLAAGLALSLALAAFLLQGVWSHRVAGGLGAVCFIAVVAACSSDLRRVEWRTVAWGLALQVGLALFILRFSIGGWRPGYELFAAVAAGAGQFLKFTGAGAEFVFG